MNDWIRSFYHRIGFPEHEAVTFESLPKLLELTSRAMPFENLGIIGQRTSPITKQNLIDKVVVRQEGGLCYELNPLLHHFLLEHGLHTKLTRGIVFNHEAAAYSAVGRTHVAILLEHQQQIYLLDTGFGGNLPLMPVPLSGETVSSSNGEFRVVQAATEYGDYIMQMKLKHKDIDWRLGYAFDSNWNIIDDDELNEIQTLIVGHAQSSFNKHPLITRLTDSGSVTLTDKSLTQWIDGEMVKESIEQAEFQQYMQRYFPFKFDQL